MSRITNRIAFALLLGFGAVGCGGEEVTSTTAAPSTTLDATETATTTAPTTTPATTVAPTTMPPTTVAPTTVPVTTAVPTTVPATSAPATTTPAAPAAPTPDTAFVTVGSELVEIDVATGASVRVLDEFFDGDGVFRGNLRLSPDRSTMWFSEGYEDSWFSCGTSVGSWGRVDVASGAVEVLGSGGGVEPSADGEFVAYSTSSLCLPDPENPEFWVLTPEDRVVVRQLSTGDEREFVTDTPPDSYDSPSVVRGAGFSPGGDLLVLLGDGRLFNVDLDGPSVIQEHPVALSEVVGFPIAATTDDLIALVYGDEGSTDLIAIDARSGDSRPLASAGEFLAAGVSADGQIVVTSLDEIIVTDRALVTVVEVAGDDFVFDIDW